MVPDLENMVCVVVHPIKAEKAFDELQNLYKISRYPGGTGYLFYWTILVFSVLVNHSICRVDGSKLQNWSWYWLTKVQKIRFPWNPTRQRASPFIEVVWADLSFLLRDPCVLHYCRWPISRPQWQLSSKMDYFRDALEENLLGNNEMTF